MLNLFKILLFSTSGGLVIRLLLFLQPSSNSKINSDYVFRLFLTALILSLSFRGAIKLERFLFK